MGITVAVCLDDEGGMLFFGRRQSRDRNLISELCESVDGDIYISRFSEIIFKGHEEKIKIVDNPLEECPDGGVAFVENLRLSPYSERISRILLYKWNTLYPSDFKIDIDLVGLYGTLSREDFVGSSHDQITKLTLVKKAK